MQRNPGPSQVPSSTPAQEDGAQKLQFVPHPEASRRGITYNPNLFTVHTEHSFCFCVPLRTGCYFIGSFYLAYSICANIKATLDMVNFTENMEQSEEWNERMRWFHVLNVCCTVITLGVALAVVVGAWRNYGMVLKICAPLLLLTCVFPVFSMAVMVGEYNLRRKRYFFLGIFLFFTTYCAGAVWSYGSLLRGTAPLIVYERHSVRV